MISLDTVILSHLNDLGYADDDSNLIKFIRTIIFYNPNLDIKVSDQYLDWFWKRVISGQPVCDYKTWYKPTTRPA